MNIDPTLCYFNGLNGASGQPLIKPLAYPVLLSWLKADDKAEDPGDIQTLLTIYEKQIEARVKGTWGTKQGIDAADIKQARWGVIFAPSTPNDVREALQDLIHKRDGQVLDRYQPGEKPTVFRAHYGQGPGVVDPDKIPYYILIIGSPQEISYKFQYGLDAEHAVGRLYFDSAHKYADYAQRLLDYEKKEAHSQRERRVAVFSPQNKDDVSTYLSATELAAPLALELGKPFEHGIQYKVEYADAAAATRARLEDFLTRSSHAPSLLFTASHGMTYPSGDPSQRGDQGAWVCQEWPPPGYTVGERIPDSVYLAGRHLAPGDRFDGLVVFSFACFSAGTPQLEDFACFKHRPPLELAPQPFLADLPARLLAQGALAFIGHVEQTWDYSYLSVGVGRDITVFQSTLQAILEGVPLGHAMEYVNYRYVNLARDLTDLADDGMLHNYNLGDAVDEELLVKTWMAHNDARAYILIGDPAARLKPEALKAPVS